MLSRILHFPSFFEVPYCIILHFCWTIASCYLCLYFRFWGRWKMAWNALFGQFNPGCLSHGVSTNSTALTYPPNGWASKMNRSNTKPEFPGNGLLNIWNWCKNLEPPLPVLAAETSKEVNWLQAWCFFFPIEHDGFGTISILTLWTLLSTHGSRINLNS